MDDIVRTVRGEPSCLHDAANSLHLNLQFTLEETNSGGGYADPGLEHKCIAGEGCNLQLVSKTNRYWDYTEL